MQRDDVLALSRRKGWSETCAQGYADGEACRNRGERPQPAAIYGVGQYSLGFRAGFFGIPLIDSIEAHPYLPGVVGPLQPSWTGPERRKKTVELSTAVLARRQAGSKS